MSEPRNVTAILRALRAKRNQTQRATSPRVSNAPRAASVTRSRSTASRLETLQRQRERAAEMEASPALAASAAKASRPLGDEVASLERRVAALNQNHRDKLAAAENYRRRRAESRNGHVRHSESLTGNSRFSRPGVRTSTAKKANNAVEEINREYKKLEREASKVETALRHAREDLARKQVRLQSMASMPPRAVSTSSRKAASTSNINAQIVAAREKLATIEAKKRAAVEKKTDKLSKRMDAAFKKLEVFEDDELEAFCEELKDRKRRGASSRASSRASSPKAAAAAANNLNVL